jgi:hypothetical protein
MQNNCGEAHLDLDMSMEIDLTKIKTVCISLPDSSLRRSNIERLMNNLQFTNWSFFDGVQADDPVVGCAKSHMQVLKNHDFSEPILVLEDDVDATPDYKQCFEIPNDTDAVYLGYSWWAWDTERAKMSKLDGETSFVHIKSWQKSRWYKVTNMTSAHAVLYTSKAYAESVIEEVDRYLADPKGNKHCDVAMARIQNKYQIIAPAKHHFFQICPRNTMWTNRSIE